MCSYVALASTTACSPISANKFVLDTNYSFPVSCAVGQTNERQQSPRHRGLFVSTVTGVGEEGGKQKDHIQAVGLKVTSWKEGGYPGATSLCLHRGLTEKDVNRRFRGP